MDNLLDDFDDNLGTGSCNLTNCIRKDQTHKGKD